MPNRKLRILLVEDNDGDARILRELLHDAPRPHQVTRHETLKAGLMHLASQPVDVAVLDLGLPDAEGLAVVSRARAAAPSVPLVVLTGRDDPDLAAAALHQGAQDYLVKGQIDPRNLVRALRYAIERKKLEDALFLEKERAEITMKSIGDAVVSTDTMGRIAFINPVAETLSGWSLCEALGQPMDNVVQILNGPGGALIRSVDAGGDVHGLRSRVDGTLLCRAGAETPVEGSISSILDRSGQILGEVIVFRDVSAARAMSNRLIHSAQHDFLTGLPNRMLLNDRVGHAIAIAPRHAKRVAILFLDLDGFKQINDTLGHAVGDKLLQSVALRLGECVRASDTVSRQGGDEFVVLLSEVHHPEDAAITARRMLEAVALPHAIDDHALNVTTSIGVSIYPDDAADAETLIKNADVAMYQAKEGGRQSFQFFKPAMHARAVERQSIEQSLRSALERGELAVHYQPKVDLRSGLITGAEALLRWSHPSLGLIAPSRFIGIAEECGLIMPIGAWVLREACAEVRRWRNAGLPLTSIAVNISAMEFRSTMFVDRLFEAL